MHLYYAKTIADDLVSQLEPYCEVIHIAGSVRRKKEEVKDIEIVCIPKRINNEERDLFGEIIHSNVVIHPQFDRITRTVGKILKGKPAGRYMQVEIKREIESIGYNINIDFFLPQQHDYYRQLAIRTGSAEYAHRYIAIHWNKKGWCGTEDGLRRISECYKVSPTKWVMKKEFIDKPTLPPVWESERHLFQWLNVQYLEPDHRSL